MRSIDGKLLKEMLLSGANNLYNHYPEIDALNVFPVPDGDTGMNMNLTLQSGAKEIENRTEDDVHSIALSFSKGLLMGARGNSGVITSQIFRGFAQALEGKKGITAKDLAVAFTKGSEIAYKAVMKPVEGTILTVIRESAKGLSDAVEDLDVVEAMKKLLDEAKASLKRTPDLLPILKEVGVVDSGGAGLVKIFEGMNSAIKGKMVEKKTISRSQVDATAQNKVEGDEFGYCTEFIMRLDGENKKPFIESRFKSVLQTHGNSLVIVRDEEIVKVHVHTLNPGAVLTYAQTFGEFIKIKVENMTEQHTQLAEAGNAPEQKVEAKVETPAVPKKDVGLVAVAAGKGVEKMFVDLGVDAVVSGGQTMNPSIEDIVNVIRSVNAKEVYVFPNNGNIVMAALQAKDVLADEIKVNVVSTKTIPHGIAAVSQYSPDLSTEENMANMKEVIGHITSCEITYAIKDTSIDGVEVKKDDFMAIVNKKIICCESSAKKALMKMFRKTVKEENYLATVLVGENVKDDEMKEIQEELTETYPNLEFDISRGDQPVYDFIIGIE